MSVNPFHSVMTSRAAFDAGQRQTDVVSNLNLNDISGQPPLSQSREQNLALKVKAPPLTPGTLDLGGNTYGSGTSEVNSAGILKSYAGIFGRTQGEPAAFTGPAQDAPKTPGTVAFKPDAVASLAAGKSETLTFTPPEYSTLKPGTQKPTDTIAQNADATLPKRTSPSMSLAEFQAVQKETGDKFASASYDLSIKHSDGGSIFKHKYTPTISAPVP
jgi:hypothetical protein